MPLPKLVTINVNDKKERDTTERFDTLDSLNQMNEELRAPLPPVSRNPLTNAFMELTTPIASNIKAAIQDPLGAFGEDGWNARARELQAQGYPGWQALQIAERELGGLPRFVGGAVDIVADPLNIVGGGLAAQATTKAATLGGKAAIGLGVGAVEGAAIGGVYGAATADAEGRDPLQGALFGSAFGGALGGVLGGLGGALSGRSLAKTNQPVAPVANTFVPHLKPFADEIANVDVKEVSGLTRYAQNANLFNKLPDSMEGRLTLAAERQTLAAGEAAEFIAMTAFDSRAHTVRGGLRELWPVNQKTGMYGKTGVHFVDIIERLPQYEAQLTPQQIAAVTDVRLAARELLEYARSEGVELPGFNAGDTDFVYFRRLVDSLRGVELERKSNPKFARMYEFATEAAENGVDYNTNPREGLKATADWVYKQVIDKRVSEAAEPFGINPSALVPAPVRGAYAEALQNQRTVEQSIRTLRREVGELEKRKQVARATAKGYGDQEKFLDAEIGMRRATLTDIDAKLHMRDEPAYKDYTAWRVETQQSERRVASLTSKFHRTDVELARVRERMKNADVYGEWLEREAGRLVRIWNDPELTGKLTKKIESQVNVVFNRTHSEQVKFAAIEQLEQNVTLLRDGLRTALANEKVALTLAKKEFSRANTDVQRRLRELGVESAAKFDERRFTGRAATAGKRARRYDELTKDAAFTETALKDLLKQLESTTLKEVRTASKAARAELTRAKERALNAQVAPLAKFGKATVDLFGPNAPADIPVALWKNRIFPRDFARGLEWGLTSEQRKVGPATTAMASFGHYTRFLSATGDFGWLFNQGLLVMATNPKAWAVAAKNHFAAFLDAGTLSRYMRDPQNFVAAKEMLEAGIPIQETELYAALRHGQTGEISLSKWAAKLDATKHATAKARIETVTNAWHVGARNTIGRFQATYDTATTVGRIELWKALKPNWKGETPALAQYIRNLTGGLDSRALGIGPSQRAAEGMWLAFAPRLLRSTVGLTVMALQGASRVAQGMAPLPQQQAAIRSITQLMAGVAAIYTVTGIAMGRDADEIGNGLNPLSGKQFLSYKVGDDWIGVGGQMRAFTQVVAKLVSALAPGGEPIDDLVSVDQNENPLIQAYVYRGAVGLNAGGTILEGVTGGRVDALPYDQVDNIANIPEHLASNMVPFALQSFAEGQGPLAAGIAGLGARTSASTPGDVAQVVTDELAAKGALSAPAGTPFYELDRADRRLVEEDERVAKRRADLPQRPGPSDSELVAVALEQWKESKRSFETDAKKKLGFAKSGTQRREILKDLAQNRYTASQVLFDGVTKMDGPVDPRSLRDAFAEQYWSVDAPEDPNTGAIDFDAQQAQRDVILQQARAAGVDPNYIVADGPGTYRGTRFADPTVATAVRQREAARDLLREYWAIPETALPAPLANLYAQYRAVPANERAFFAMRNPIMRDVVRFVEQAQLQMRMSRSEVDAALVEWYDAVPAANQLTGVPYVGE